MLYKNLKTIGLLAVLASMSSVGHVQAAPAATTIGAPVFFVPNACAIYGDFYSCSTQLLEGVLSAPNNTYAKPVGPGQLQSNIVIGDNPGNNPTNDLINTDIAATGVDNGYQTPTGQTAPMSFSTKTIPDPSTGTTFSPEFTGDRTDTWDISLSVLKDFLNGGDLLVGFDHNQVGSGYEQNLLAWATVVFTGTTGQVDKVFELTNSTLNDPLAFTSGKALGGDPTAPTGTGAAAFASPGDYVVSNGNLCSAGFYTTKTDCESFGGTWADNNKGNRIDYIIWSPEINTFLGSDLLSDGYTTMHVRWDMLELNDGAETAFIMRGTTSDVPVPIPEPGSLALLGLALAGLGFVRSRKS